MSDELDDLLGINPADPTQQLALELVDADDQLLRRLVALRNEKSLTQGEIGRRMGVTQPAVAAFEKADADPKLSTIRRYALALGVLVRHSVVDHFSSGSSAISNVSRTQTGAAARRPSHLRVNPTSSILSVAE
ncbi:helix-turn-helix domain-containing protein [Amycolatopsis sp. cmx-4-61]|uniref:helix-turn-helix domain-containing protein n=1 Tax=Amycolatopsis sp. cmx-4-61 TaxID=2790937 RepID=UPI00397D16A1